MDYLLRAFLSLSILAAVYPVLLYPLLVMLLARFRPRPWREADVHEPVAHLITVHNEEQRIRGKLENSLELVAPRGGIETIVISDGSSDRTEEIVERYASRGVRLIRCPRRGKERAQIDALHEICAPIVVFSDAATRLEPDAITALIAPLADPEVAAVSGTDRLNLPDRSTGEDLYVSYEMALRRAECLSGSLVGLSGCLFAVRRELCDLWVPDVPNDMGSALLAIATGRRAVAAERALCTYGALGSPGSEFRRKRRTALRGIRGLFAYRSAMARGGPVEVWQVVSHKLMRFLVPFFVLLALGSLAVGALGGLGWARWPFLLAVVAGGVGSLGVVFPRLTAFRPLRALSFALLTMAAVISAWVGVFRRDRGVVWVPTERA